jgi:hypothetical protein
MNDNKGSIAGTIVTTLLAWFTKIVANFESHAAAYAALATVIVAICTVANIFFGPFSSKRKPNLEDEP